jgi:hypothetical protein
MSRPIYEIAHDIQEHWPKVYFAAVPYLRAMFYLNDISDRYYYDSAETIVLHFLVNATTWRGEDARRIKAELRALLK